MIWPHQITDPRSIAVFRLLCAASVACSISWPGLSAGQRFVIGVLSLFGLSSGFLCYGLLLFLARCVPVLNRALAFLVFYGAVVSTLLLPVEYAYDASVGGVRADFTGAGGLALTLTANLGAWAAGFNALQRD
jgi:hypothetical protein